MRYEQHDSHGSPIKCANGSDAKPCYRRPELTLRETDSDKGRWLGTVCGSCAADLIDAGKAKRSTENAFRIALV